MNEKPKAGFMKKSFELNFHNGTIWREHLDGMGEYEAAVINKLRDDKIVVKCLER